MGAIGQIFNSFKSRMVGAPLRVSPWGAASAALSYQPEKIHRAAVICTLTPSCKGAREFARITLARRRPFATHPHRYAALRHEKQEIQKSNHVALGSDPVSETG
jgi:hypothetical protein